MVCLKFNSRLTGIYFREYNVGYIKLIIQTIIRVQTRRIKLIFPTFRFVFNRVSNLAHTSII